MKQKELLERIVKLEAEVAQLRWQLMGFSIVSPLTIPATHPGTVHGSCAQFGMNMGKEIQ